jgi:hypothetical protein
LLGCILIISRYFHTFSSSLAFGTILGRPCQSWVLFMWTYPQTLDYAVMACRVHVLQIICKKWQR